MDEPRVASARIEPEQSPIRMNIAQYWTGDHSPVDVRQVGWIGHSGAIYNLEDPPYDNREPGGFTGLLVQGGD